MNWDGRIRANALHIPLADESVHMVVTSPPYFSLRSYQIPPTVWDGDPDCPHAFLIPKKVRRMGSTNGRGAQGSTLGGANNKSTLGPGLANDEDGASKLRTDHSSFCQCGAWLGHLGLELTVQDYVRHIVQVFREVRRVLRSDGVCFMNLGDSYAQTGGAGLQGATTQRRGRRNAVAQQKKEPQSPPPGFQAKDLMLIPHRCAIALQEDGWIVRNDLVWQKGQAMPESCIDRCTKDHEYIFHLVKSQRYYWDMTAIAEPASPDTHARYARGRSDSHEYSEGQQTIMGTFEHKAGVTPKAAPAGSGIRNNESFSAAVKDVVATRNKRTVWRLNTASYSEAHYACVDEKTECLTIDGWKKFDELTIGMLAANFSIKEGTIRFDPIEDISAYKVTSETVVKAHHRHEDFVFSRNHRCLISSRSWKTKSWRNIRIVEAAHLRDSYVFPCSAPWLPSDIHIQAGPLSEDWAELIGWYLAEGYEGVECFTVEIYQSKAVNPLKCARIENLLKKVCADYWVVKAPRKWAGRDATMYAFQIRGFAATYLRQMVPGSKTMPQGVLSWSGEMLSRFLYGLIEGDGHRRSEDERFSFIQKSKITADLVQAIGVRLGYATKVSRHSKGTYTVFFTDRPMIGFKGLNGGGGSISTEKYSGVLWCPKLPNGTWVARRDGRMFITGNTFPPAIPETTILVGTSAHGVCSACGAPWVRQTEKIVAPGRGSGNKERKHRDLFGGNPDHSAHLGFGVPYVPNATVTTGWAAACACDAGVVPATVLDIFAGSNTTGMVAERLGHRWIGLDLGYQDMQERRLQNVQRDLRLDAEAR